MCTREAAVVSSTGAWANLLAAFPSLEPERQPSLRASSTLRRSAKWIAMTLLSGWLASSAIAAPRCADLFPKESTCGRYNVSLVDLTANSEQFDGKRVVVAGFLSLEFEGHALYSDSRPNLAGSAQGYLRCLRLHRIALASTLQATTHASHHRP
jgi:hypothetical protein